MSRLIDADAFEKFIKEKYKDCESTDDIKDQVLFDLSYQPTAYDTNKVALELRHLAFRLPKDYCGLDGKDRAVMFDDAIDIVRKGGIE